MHSRQRPTDWLGCRSGGASLAKEPLQATAGSSGLKLRQYKEAALKGRGRQLHAGYNPEGPRGARAGSMLASQQPLLALPPRRSVMGVTIDDSSIIPAMAPAAGQAIASLKGDTAAGGTLWPSSALPAPAHLCSRSASCAGANRRACAGLPGDVPAKRALRLRPLQAPSWCRPYMA